MARPKPSAPSSRVYAAFAVATIVGIATFLIWWITSDARQQREARAAGAGGRAADSPLPAKPAPIETSLPRGGALSGSADDVDLALDHLTGAPLVRVNHSTDEVEPWLAESWTASDDRRRYTLRLRPNVTSAAGAPLTAADAAKSLAALAANGRPISVRAVDQLTLEIIFPAPFAPGLRALDRFPLAGFGPFVAEAPSSRRTPSRTLRRNANYWRRNADGAPLPYVDEIALGAGGQDFADAAVRAEDYEAVKKLELGGKVRVYDLGPGLDADALWFSPSPPGEEERPWLTAEALRLAISAAVDRRAYCKQVFIGACDPMAGPVSPANLAWFNPDLPLGPGNEGLARTMIEELGLRDRTGDGILDDAALRPVRFTLLIRRDVSASARAATFLADTLKRVGVQVDVTPLTADALAARRRKGTYDAIYDRIEMRDTDPAMNLEFWLSSGLAHVWNPARTNPPADWERQIDGFMTKNAESFDRIERLQAFIDAQKIYLQHMPAVFFGTPRIRVVTSTRTLNATPSPLRPHILWNAESLAALP